MNFDTLEKEFKYYHNLLEWEFIFRAIKGYTSIANKDMSEIINSIIIGVTTGLSTVEATKNFETVKRLVNNEKFKDFLSKIIGISEKNLNKFRTKSFRSFDAVRVAIIFSEVYRILEENNVDTPQKIAEKILIRSIEFVSEDENIETSQELQKRWANLLANAAYKKDSINASFIRILDELDPQEAKILNFMYEEKLDYEKFPDWLHPYIEIEKIQNELQLSEYKIFMLIGMLSSKQLIEIENTVDEIKSKKNNTSIVSRKPHLIRLTALGFNFIKAISSLNTSESFS